jgi:hypothetical protein
LNTIDGTKPPPAISTLRHVCCSAAGATSAATGAGPVAPGPATSADAATNAPANK